jgi:replicative superfamily II helicase
VWDVHRSASDLGCWVDIVSTRLIAISATVDTAQEVANWLASAEASGLLQYETARANDKS